MKILQMLDVPWDSGLAHYALVLAQGLQAQGHQVWISSIPGEKPWAKAQRLGLKTVPLVTLMRLADLRKFLLSESIDLVNAHTGRTHSVAVAAAVGRPAAVVRTRSDARAVRRSLGSGWLYRHTQRVIAAADYIRDDFLQTLRLSKEKVVTVYQGLDTRAFASVPPPADPIAGIVARLDPVKGHRYLIEALSLLCETYPRLKLKIAGQEENVKQRDLLNIAERLRLENRIEFMGFQKDVASVMAGCSIGVIASTGSEAVSRVALEWMAAGRPLVATRVGCLPEIVRDGETGQLEPPKDAPALAHGIAKLLGQSAKLSAVGSAARRRAEQVFGLDRFVEKTLAVYEEAIAERRAK
jgi:glycosyltransferase involved in cell wall biosynthesis